MCKVGSTVSGIVIVWCFTMCKILKKDKGAIDQYSPWATRKSQEDLPFKTEINGWIALTKSD